MSGVLLQNPPPHRSIQEALRDFIIRLPLIRQGLRLVWKAARNWTILWGILLLIQGVLPAVQVALARLVVDRLAVVTVGSIGREAAQAAVLAPAAMMALLWMTGQGLASLIAWVRTAQAELVQDHIQSMIHERAIALDLAFYENSYSYDLLHRARFDAIQQPLSLLEHMGLIIQSGLSVLALSVLLLVYAPILPVLLVLTAVPGLWAVARYTWREHRWRIQSTVDERRARYFDWMLTERQNAAEMRLFDLGEHHRGNFQKLRQRLREGRLRLAREQLSSELLASGIAWAGGLLGMAWMVAQAIRGRASLGDVVMAYQALQQGQRLMRSLLESAGYIYRSLLFLDNLFEFLSMQPKIVEPSEPEPLPQVIEKELRFDGVTFGYPGSERPALENFTISLPAGRITAIVGENGAGKSTLIKLLCRFYDPLKGRVLVDGIDLRLFAPNELRRRITVLFQEPVHYHTSAAENIALGDLPASPSEKEIREAAREAGADLPIERLPQGYATVLGKWFGGAELSVGEWQRLALARAFLRKAAIIVLDEPTSAMDSWAEADWLNRLRELTEGRTTLIITHRFTTAMRADVIHVMKQGRIIESGTHHDLVAAGGDYARSWQAQMKDAAHD
jgi:ATP-binding cassette, subfamily B, bacterial